MIGVLEEGASYLDTELNSDVVSMDDQIVIPMIYQAKEWGRLLCKSSDVFNK